jgi:UDP-N-acetylmuramate-alanine ligase
MRGRPVVWAPTLERAAEALAARLGPGTVAVTVGAGDVHRVGERLVGEAGDRRDGGAG